MKLIPVLIVLALWTSVTLGNDGPVAARVNGEEISAFRLERYFVEYLEDQGRAVGSIRNPKAYKQLHQQALDALIDRELLWQESVQRGVVISDASVQHQIDQTRQAMGGAEVFARRLQEAGFDEAGYFAYTRQELAARQVFTELTDVAPPGEQEVRAFYDAHRTEQNQWQLRDVTELQGLATVRAYLARQRHAEARLEVLAQLRSRSRVERIDGQ